jgi:glycosyltransferase involved in cell wall biosynthesis
MRIGIDALPLRGSRTGIGNYVGGLIRWLPEIQAQHEYFLYSNQAIGMSPLSPGTALQQRIDDSFGSCPGALWLLGRLASLAKRDDLDVFWASTTILPYGLPASVLKIVTVHDLVWLRYPETTTRYNLFLQKAFARRGIAEADIVLVNSRSTQEELVQTLAIPFAKTRVIYPIISEIYKPQPPEEAARYISATYKVPNRYMATVGTVEPRKNLQLLVEAARILKERNQLSCPILVVGAKGWKNSYLSQMIRDAGLCDRDISFMGYLPDADMPSFYSGAQAFLFPSMYEGFGFPPVEAMACGVPVIASNAQCMPEVLADAAILESPASAEDFATAITRVLSDESLRASMRKRGIGNAQRFASRSSAERLLEVFDQKLCRVPA